MKSYTYLMYKEVFKTYAKFTSFRGFKVTHGYSHLQFTVLYIILSATPTDLPPPQWGKTTNVVQ